MKEPILTLLSRYAKMALAFFCLPLLIRSAEVIYFSVSYELTSRMIGLELMGLGLDLLYLIGVYLVLLPLFLLVSIRFPKTARWLFFSLMLVMSVIWFSLIKYFITTLIPLDQVLFAYTVEEIIRIVLSSTSIDPVGLVVFPLLVLWPFLFLRLTRNWHPGRGFLTGFGILGMVTLIAFPFIMPSRDAFSRDFDYYLMENKFHYALKKCSFFVFSHYIGSTSSRIEKYTGQTTMPADIRLAAERYQQSNPSFSYYSTEYPFLRKDNTPDALGKYLSLKQEPPNIVFIIVESLSTSFMGEDAWFGSYMPFLDSLRTKSLYWKNCLSSSERTFHVLPAILGSLPYAHGAFLDNSKQKPNHFSFIRYLKKAGYFGGFYYGGDPAFTNYGSFLTQEGVDYILDFYDPKYEENVVFDDWFRWGYTDGDLFDRALTVLDSMDRSPRLDIFLTLSMHAPFKPPDAATYHARVDQRLNEPGVTDRQREATIKLKQVFATILYTDDMLRQFFHALQQKPEFDNTLFIITGDHAMPELHTSHSTSVEKYHVPLIIYSRMLTQPARFTSVVSHFDIAPTLLALLKSNNMAETHPYCHWLGGGLSVDDEKDHPVMVSFAFNNTEEVEFLKNHSFLSYNKRYQRDKELGLTMINDNQERDKLKILHESYLALTRYVVENNAMVPDYLFYEDAFHESRINPGEQLIFEDGTTSGEFISLMRPVPLEKEFDYMDLELGISIRCGASDTLKLPVLVFEVKDSAYANHFYTPVSLSYESTIADSTGTWSRYRLHQRMDIGFISRKRDKFVKMYFWNQNRITVTMDSLTFQLTGYFKPDANDYSIKP